MVIIGELPYYYVPTYRNDAERLLVAYGIQLTCKRYFGSRAWNKVYVMKVVNLVTYNTGIMYPVGLMRHGNKVLLLLCSNTSGWVTGGSGTVQVLNRELSRYSYHSPFLRLHQC